MLYGCSSREQNNVCSQNIVADSIYDQQFVDSLLSSIKCNNQNSHISYLGLNGHVKSIDYSIVGEGFDLPFEIINFEDNCNISSIYNGQYYFNHIIDDNPEKKILRLGTDEAGVAIEFNMVRSDNKSIFEIYDEMGSSQFTFTRNSNNEICNLSIIYKFYPDMTSDEFEESHESFSAKVNSYDNHDNWTSITFFSNNKNTTVTRKITYIEESSIIKVYHSDSIKEVFFKIPTRYSGFHIHLYRCDSDKWEKLLPPPYENEMFGYNDYRFIGDNLYLIFNTGNNYIGAVCGVYKYNVKTNSWNELDMGGEDCKFVGNRIKVPHFEITKYGDCSANNEYKETITWIELK